MISLISLIILSITFSQYRTRLTQKIFLTGFAACTVPAFLFCMYMTYYMAKLHLRLAAILNIRYRFSTCRLRLLIGFLYLLYNSFYLLYFYVVIIVVANINMNKDCPEYFNWLQPVMVYMEQVAVNLLSLEILALVYFLAKPFDERKIIGEIKS